MLNSIGAPGFADHIENTAFQRSGHPWTTVEDGGQIMPKASERSGQRQLMATIPRFSMMGRTCGESWSTSFFPLAYRCVREAESGVTAAEFALFGAVVEAAAVCSPTCACLDNFASVGAPLPSENPGRAPGDPIAECILNLADARANHRLSAGFFEGNALALQVAGGATDSTRAAVFDAVFAVEHRAGNAVLRAAGGPSASRAAVLSCRAVAGARIRARRSRVVGEANDVNAIDGVGDATGAIRAALLTLTADKQVAGVLSGIDGGKNV